MARVKSAKKLDNSEKIYVRTFGGLSIFFQGAPISIIWESQKARLLFCYLMITSEQWVHRDKFIEMLWPGCDAAAGANNFKTTLSRLRKSFTGPRVINPVITQGEAVRINIYDIDVDASQFRIKAASGIKLHAKSEIKAAREFLETAHDIYTGDFLPEEPFNEYITSARKEFAELDSSVLVYLERIYRNEGDTDALEAFQILNKNMLPNPV
jgi:SARP family transcriptional regulator, regulator of embCAB operon